MNRLAVKRAPILLSGPLKHSASERSWQQTRINIMSITKLLEKKFKIPSSNCTVTEASLSAIAQCTGLTPAGDIGNAPRLANHAGYFQDQSGRLVEAFYAVWESDSTWDVVFFGPAWLVH
jgi:hypothetical protein